VSCKTGPNHGCASQGEHTPRLDENQAEFGVLVLAVGLKVLADSDGLLDQHVKVLGDFGCQALRKLCVSNETKAGMFL
jgi:hypothetical protein